MNTVPLTDAPVRIIQDHGVSTVQIHRPTAMNALDMATKHALLTALTDVAQDDNVRCVVLTGAGRAFCVGQDLHEHVAALTADHEALGTTVTEHYNPIVSLLATMDKPVIAAINGVAAGAGMAFAFAADLRVMAASAGMNPAFAGIALSCDSGTSYWLPRLVGPARAKALLLRPRTIPADECLRLGLIDQLVPDDELESTVAQLASDLAAGPTLAYGALRRSVAYGAGHDLEQTLEFEAQMMARTGASADHRVAVEAFLTKQAPQFNGR
ncbi:1,2-epoxyphenylacetyl-CoA isomerase [Austwickia sp. TVS 96-490-7B]|uniref:enoyl-CoA hydratase/isomerase family protein n=1 Tax=Austwickia sp. TVS 96-490-7B TaxID=2830843 RepID=UPI001C55B864|nr:enoyl-CoA hydratase-related protein [Austwickia sp. TVS 96-490-7B]MBW3086664.1 1,2-epoxyphenylacetyl-CoA isomerase [Austwickia sp. TVS 96-490-7B]